MKRPQILDKVLNSPNNELEALVTHAKQLRRLQGLFHQVVPEGLAKNCQIANFSNGQLSLSCQSSAWAMRAKMEKLQLLEALQAIDVFAQLRDIQAFTQPKQQAIDNKEIITKMSMSSESAHVIAQMAEAISDPELSKSLQRLARHKDD